MLPFGTAFFRKPFTSKIWKIQFNMNILQAEDMAGSKFGMLKKRFHVRIQHYSSRVCLTTIPLTQHAAICSQKNSISLPLKNTCLQRGAVAVFCKNGNTQLILSKYCKRTILSKYCNRTILSKYYNRTYFLEVFHEDCIIPKPYILIQVIGLTVAHLFRNNALLFS